MDSTKLLFGTLAGTVTSFIAGFLIFGLALKNYSMQTSSAVETPQFVWLVLGHIIFSLLFTYICLQWAGISTAATGAKAAATIGFLFSLGMNCYLYGGYEFYTSGGVVPIFVGAIAGAIVWAAGGAGVGWALGRGSGGN